MTNPLTAQRSAEWFASSPVARLATVSAGGAPHLVPVTFAVIEGPERIVFAVDHKPKRTENLRRLTNIAAQPLVCFLVDHYDDDWARLWWVRADARAAVLDSGPERELAIDALAVKYRHYRALRPAGSVVIAEVTRWSGWAAAD